MATNLALQLQVIEPDTDLNSIMIGNSRYSDDIWDLRPFIISKSLDLSKTSLRFRYISDTDMKETVKQYTYYKLGKTNEYSCAVTPQVRQTGNRLSGLAGTAYASLLT